ncbi:MAG TPA: hypothetical protein VL307_08900 [Chitinophagaceae bacterium]|nr:hypothetical protein [Chitinophagaceae bacterium]
MKKISIISVCTLLTVICLIIGCKKEMTQPNSNNEVKTGTAMLWVATDLGCGTITVECNGITKSITGYNSGGAPACGASGAATFTLDPGTYTYTAKCSNLTWNGSITVTAGNCSKVQLTGSGGGGAGTNTGQAMFWTAADLGCGTITVTCNGISKNITGYNSGGAPACGAAGAATFDLNAGTYSYAAQCSGKTWNGTITVNGGACSKLQLTSTSNTTTTGQAMFWLASDLGCGTITVTCNGISRNITGYSSSGAPACGSSNSANFDLSAGSYSYTAKCNGFSWNGTVTVTANACNKIQLTAPANTNTTGKAMFWISSDLACGTITVTCNGTTASITSYYKSGTPSCGATGCANFTLKPGTYSYSGKCSNKTWSGSVTITANGCSTIRFY